MRTGDVGGLFAPRNVVFFVKGEKDAECSEIMYFRRIYNLDHSESIEDMHDWDSILILLYLLHIGAYDRQKSPLKTGNDHSLYP